MNEGRASIEAVEGFVRQVSGWREFIHGFYWLDMPGMRQTISQTLTHGYAHHIQRPMVTGIFGLLAETKPQEIEDWYLSVYIDAVDLFELPNVAGMALFANSGCFTSKPYIASGQYIKRKSNYCLGCRYKLDVKSCDNACPFATLYRNFLDKHEKAVTGNPRTALMVKNIACLTDDERAAIRGQAAITLQNLDNI